jgi:hypothetical protein
MVVRFLWNVQRWILCGRKKHPEPLGFARDLRLREGPRYPDFETSFSQQRDSHPSGTMSSRLSASSLEAINRST